MMGRKDEGSAVTEILWCSAAFRQICQRVVNWKEILEGQEQLIMNVEIDIKGYPICKSVSFWLRSIAQLLLDECLLENLLKN